MIGQLPSHKNYYLKRFFHRPVVPHHIIFDITEHCNLKCAHCADRTFQTTESELSTSEVCACFDSLLSLGKERLPYIALNGGEPFLKKGLDEVISFLEGHSFPWGIITNGTCEAPAVMQKITSSRHLRMFRVSLDGLEKNHNALRGSPDCFEKTIAFIKQTRESNLKIRLVFTVTALNIDDILPTARLAARLGCHEIHFSLIAFSRSPEKLAHETELQNLFQKKERNCRISLKNERLLTPDTSKLWNALNHAKKIRSIKVIVTPDLSASKLSDYFSSQGIRRNDKCVFPWFGMRIDAAGNVYPCRSINIILGNVRTTPLIDLFNGTAFEEFRSRFDGQTLSICQRCSYRNGRLNWRTLLTRLRDGYH
ncbi:MAG: radical SAM protein [Candidatus Omnitrophota bacterium]